MRELVLTHPYPHPPARSAHSIDSLSKLEYNHGNGINPDRCDALWHIFDNETRKLATKHRSPDQKCAALSRQV